jgi:D-amino-acid dehydrogenase
MKIAIVGAGVIGLASARALMRQGGHSVTVFDRAPGPGQEASDANGALLHPSSVEPWNSPGILGVLWRSVGREDSAMLLRWRTLPTLVGWGLRFVRESTPERFRAHTLANAALAMHSQRCLAPIAAGGVAFDHYRRGTLMVLRDRASLASAAAWAEVLGSVGVRHRVLGVDEALAIEPALTPIRSQLVGAIHNLDDEAGDSRRFCDSLAEALRRDGVAMRLGTTVEAITLQRGTVRGLRLTGGAEEPFDAVVLAAGASSVALAKGCGLALPVRPAKGYSVTFELAAFDERPRVPVIDRALHVGVTPVGTTRLRVAGTAEFRGYDRRIVSERVDNLRRQIGLLYPALMSRLPAASGTPWTGLRPMCADGMPLIGPTRVAGLYLNTGHGHMGWTLAAGSGDLLARLMAGSPPPDAVDPAPFRPKRFGL